MSVLRGLSKWGVVGILLVGSAAGGVVGFRVQQRMRAEYVRDLNEKADRFVERERLALARATAQAAANGAHPAAGPAGRGGDDLPPMRAQPDMPALPPHPASR